MFSFVWCYRWTICAEPNGGKDQRRLNVRSWMNTHTSHDLKYRSCWKVALVNRSQQQGPNTADGYWLFGGLCAVHMHPNYNLQLAPWELLRGKRSKLFYTIRVDLFRNGWLMDIREAWILLLPVLQMDIQFTRSANTVPQKTLGSALQAPGSGSVSISQLQCYPSGCQSFRSLCLIPNHILHHCFSMLIPVDLVSW